MYSLNPFYQITIHFCGKRLHWGQSKETYRQNLDDELSRSILRKFDGAVFALGSLFDEEAVHVVNQAQCVLTILYLGSRSFRACSYSYKATLRGSHLPRPPHDCHGVPNVPHLVLALVYA